MSLHPASPTVWERDAAVRQRRSADGVLVACRFRQAYAGLGLGLVGALQFFFHKDRLFIQQGFNYGQDIPDAALLLQFRNALFRLRGKQVQYLLFLFGQLHIRFEIGVILHDGSRSPASGLKEAPLYRHRPGYRDNNPPASPKT